MADAAAHLPGRERAGRSSGPPGRGGDPAAGAARRLVVVADDAGRSSAVNEAIAGAAGAGIVTAASLMPGGEAFAEAAALARALPALGVGLHVTLCDGRAVLPPDAIPGLTGPGGRLEPVPARAGWRYGLSWGRLRIAIEAEVAAQFDALAAEGLAPSHVDGHHHLHVHPMIFDVVAREAARRGVRWVRIPTGEAAGGRLLEWAVFGVLARRNRRAATREGLRTADRVVGLSRTGRIDVEYLLGAIPRLGPGCNELFVHPDLATEEGRREAAALSSPQVIEAIEREGIELTTYRAAAGRAEGSGSA